MKLKRKKEGGRRGSGRVLGVAVGRPDDGLDVPPDVEVSDDRHFPGVQKSHKVIQDHIADVLMEDALVAKLVDVELQALEFNAPVLRNVGDVKARKIREARSRAQTSELWGGELDGVFSVFGPVLEAKKLGFRDLALAIRSEVGKGDFLVAQCRGGTGFFPRFLQRLGTSHQAGDG
jgi:hypothetical protein